MIKKKNAILINNASIIFFFNEARYGYDLENYSPTMTEMNFRMRDLIFVFN